MFTIGDFAALGRVSVRMLRHYDAIGLLRPAVVDPSSGYRSYKAEQLHQLNRIIALKDLGFTLQQVGSIVHDQVGIEQLRGMLRLRRAELDARIAADSARLNAVEVRLRLIESEGHMPSEDVVIKSVPPVRVAALRTTVSSYNSSEIGPAIQPLYNQLLERIQAAGITPVGEGISFYDGADDPIQINAAIQVNVDPDPKYDFNIVDLPAIEAATLIHRGSMEHVDASYQVLAQWIEAHGYRMTDHAREVMLEFSEDREKWVNEIQIGVKRA
jgi:DNA-binding transcriptional MerR regulator